MQGTNLLDGASFGVGTKQVGELDERHDDMVKDVRHTVMGGHEADLFESGQHAFH